MGELPILGVRSLSRVSADLIGTSEAMCAVRKMIARVASSEASVLITGASGTGKENVARALHGSSSRAAHPFVAVNCGAIPKDLAEAELFGAEAGAFTGAQKSRVGSLEAADGGSLFLDEVGELPLELQVKLLRVLETREIQRLGSSKPISVNFRLICATNVDLEDAVQDNRFREDLYWRLAVVMMHLPNLAERIEDIPALIEHFADLRQGKLHLTECGQAVLSHYGWPGNLRELRNLVDRCLAMQEHVLDAERAQLFLRPRKQSFDSWLTGTQETRPLRSSVLPEHLQQGAQPMDSGSLKQLLDQTETLLIAQALHASNGRIAESARLLGLKRTTLVEKMKRKGLKAANEAA